MALPACECLPGLYPNWKALGPIVAAARTWAGESEDLPCYEGRPIGEQLSALYCALFAVASGTSVEFSYLQPDGVSQYFQPDGVSLYLQP